MGVLTELVKALYNAELPDGTNLEDLVQGLGGILNGLLDGVVKPIVSDLGSEISQFIPNVLTLQLEHDTGISKTDGITSDGTVLVKGLHEGQAWEYSIDGGNTWTTGTGSSFELAPNTYAQGNVLARVSSTGETQVNISTALKAVTIDQSNPDALTAALATDTGIAGDRISQDGTINVTGLEDGAKLQYSLDNGATWKTVVSGNSFTLAEGTYANGTVQIRQVDTAGNVGDATNLGLIIIDKTVPNMPEVISFSPDGTTLYGHVAGETAGTKVTVFVNDTAIATGVTDANGNFTVSLTEGKYNDLEFTLQAKDIAGNVSSFTDGNGPDGLITVVQNVIANLSDSTMIEPVSTLVNNLVDPETGTLSGLTSIVEALTETDQPLLGALTELVAGLTAAQNTGGAGTENLGPLINGLNTLIGFLGTSDVDLLDDANSQLNALLDPTKGGAVVLDQILNPVEEGAQHLSDLLNGALGTNISLTSLDNLVNDGLLSGTVTGLTSVLNPLISALNIPLTLLGLGNLLPSITGLVNGLAKAVDNLLSGEQVIQNGVAHQIGVLDDTVKSLINHDSLLAELTKVLGLNNIPVVSALVTNLLNPIVNAVTGLLSGDGILNEPAPKDGDGVSTLGLLDVLSDIVHDLAGEGSLQPISTLVDNIIRNDGVTGDLLSAINGLTEVDGGQLGILTELVQKLYTASTEQLPENASLENLVQGVGGLLNGLLDDVVKPIVDGLGSEIKLPDLSGADTLISGLTNEVFAGGHGADTLIFKVLNDVSDSAGNGHDIWNDFKLGKIADVVGADKIDISNLLVDFDPTKTLTDFVKVEQKDGSTVISIDRDGDLNATHQFVELLTLKNVDTNLDDLLNNGQLIV